MSDPEPATIKQICDGLKAYYQSLGQQYDVNDDDQGLFEVFCDDNGFDDEGLDDEFENVNDSMLPDFDDDFPLPTNKSFKNDQQKRQFIFDIIKKCRDNPNMEFSKDIPFLDQKLFDLTKQEQENIAQTYKDQCPALWNQGMATDGGFLHVIGVGHKNNFEYLLHLVDDYCRDRVQRSIINKEKVTNWKEAQWCHPNNHKHFKKLHNQISVKLPSKQQQKSGGQKHKIVRYDELAKMAVISFGKRCCPKLQFNNMFKIDDSLEEIIHYFDVAAEFVAKLAKVASKLNRGVCPFQFDLCIASGKPHIVKEEGDDKDDDDDDDDDDEDSKDETSNTTYIDCIGDVQEKLNANKLKNVKYEYNNSKAGDFNVRALEGLLNKLRGGDITKFDGSTTYPFKKRFMGFIDRRESKSDKGKQDDIWMYEPPETGNKWSRDMPDNPVPEWGISASKTCLLPNLKYNEESAIGPQSTKELNDKTGNTDDHETKIKNSNIGSGFHAKGGLLTFSFHVKAIDQIKCYMYYNGQILRFMPQDLKIILPTMFHSEEFQNDGYLKNENLMKELDDRIKHLDEIIVDREFRLFQKSY